MGLFDVFTRSGRRRIKQNWLNAPLVMQTGILSQLATGMMEVPEIRTAIDFIARLFSTIPTTHTRTDVNGKTAFVKSDIDYVINRNPNVLQNKTQFWTTTITQLLVNNNVAILPSWDGVRLTSLIPLPFSTWTLVEDNGLWYAEFPNGEKKRVEEFIWLNKFSTLRGGWKGQAITLHQSIMQVIQRRAEQNAINPKMVQAILKMKNATTLKPDAAKARAKEISDQLSQVKDGEIPFIQGDVELEKLDISAIPIDIELLREVTETVYNYFGLSKRLIRYEATEIEREQFINTTLRPLANQVSEEFTKKLFTEREIQVGNAIELDMLAVQVATVNEKSRLIQYSIPQGVLNPNEARKLLGFGRRLDDLGDTYMQTLNNVSQQVANQYQLDGADAEENKEEEEENEKERCKKNRTR